ncbi:phosphomevalonate kinase [Leucobacter triazinivorans]|uniref:phosphomevalonate kinase n=1 Tax=Leucobacter triazinivorans TaxID=1784719 RepID=A0A4P6KCR9_9MICO|nr:phosphomevalonate kinase [Leucobacter triazinivorans]QBE48146.1 phosphomevalonate kinase [Leucobacter triazinivorans]
MIETRAPGKLYIAGEYAVVEPGEPAVLVAVDRYLSVRLTAASGEGRVRSSAYERSPLVWVRDRDSGRIVPTHDPRDYVFSAIAAVEELRAERGLPPHYFDLDIDSELDDEHGRKFGLGSSAAVTVAVIAAIDEFTGLGLSPTERFKLALLATIEVAPRASGGDLAASTFGGWIRYTSPDRDLLRATRARHGVAAALQSEEAWQGFGVTRLPRPAGLQLLVGWTGSPASTERLVAEVGRPTRVGAETAGDGDGQADRASFLDASRSCVDELVRGLAESDALALDSVRRARGLLQDLGATSGIRIETEQLRALCESAERHGAAAKPSGAGGGDCGIVLAPARLDTSALLREWEAHGILRLPLSVHPSERIPLDRPTIVGGPGEL